MIQLNDYSSPFDAILAFESAVAKFTGAPYCITTDCCTHAIEIAFRLKPVEYVEFMAKTYLSVPMTMHKLGIKYKLINSPWRDYYQFVGSNIWDCARYFKENMYVTGTIQCISFGITKPLTIGTGGCLLTDDRELYKAASRMRYDGRDIFNYSPWTEQKTFHVGYHYYMRPEDCITGLNLLAQQKFTPQLDRHFEYPDCSTITIID